MEREAAQAAVNALRGENAQWHDGTFTSWAKERSASHPYPAGEGESIAIADSDLAPWDKFTTERDASPIPPSGDEVVVVQQGDQHREDGDEDRVGLTLPVQDRRDD